MTKELADIAEAIAVAGAPLALATLLHVEGSSYRKPGARLLTDGERVLRGSLSGGCLEGEILGRSKEVLATGASQLLRYDLRGEGDLVWGTGMGCEGVLDVLIEPLSPPQLPLWLRWVQEAWDKRVLLHLATARHADALRRKVEPGEVAANEVLESFRPPPALWIVGAEADQSTLVRMARSLGWRVGVVDHRPALATAARFPEAHEVRSGRPPQWVNALPWDARTAVVLMTHNYALDREALTLLLPTKVGYLGLMGSRSRCERLRSELEGAGTPCDVRVHGPVGLDLGAQTPESIALAILAEIQLWFEGGSGRPLSVQ